MPHFVDSNRQLVIELYVRDLNRSVSFYEQLGFKLDRRDGHFAQLSWEDHHFFLDERAGLPEASESLRVNVRVLVPNVDIHWEQRSRSGNANYQPDCRPVLWVERFYCLRPRWIWCALCNPSCDARRVLTTSPFPLTLAQRLAKITFVCVFSKTLAR